ncbi:MAG: nucleotide excision repair endonuclease, partial [Phycisphaerae bacterium]|nr:nucleotide excision repair endonuclease [Phycisphaerae bacterium]
MKDAKGVVIYIGKANDLRGRVASYFQPGADLADSRGPAIASMVGQVADIDFLQTDSEVEALLIESRLIKDTQPRYNVR